MASWWTIRKNLLSCRRLSGIYLYLCHVKQWSEQWRLREDAVLLLPPEPLGQFNLHHQLRRRGSPAYRVCTVQRSVHRGAQQHLEHALSIQRLCQRAQRLTWFPAYCLQISCIFWNFAMSLCITMILQPNWVCTTKLLKSQRSVQRFTHTYQLK